MLGSVQELSLIDLIQSIISLRGLCWSIKCMATWPFAASMLSNMYLPQACVTTVCNVRHNQAIDSFVHCVSCLFIMNHCMQVFGYVVIRNVVLCICCRWKCTDLSYMKVLPVSAKNPSPCWRAAWPCTIVVQFLRRAE